MSDSIKGVFKGVKNEIINFAFAALRSGATNVGKELVNVTSDENRDEKQPSSLEFRTFTNALKTGIIGTGQELMEIGRERIMESSPQAQNSEISEESTGTKKSVEEK
ncbi:hypothetical protein [Peribacillus huizhouensis]|uniref:Uncharacterized protein n=2 Tax=Bacillaceae TaxID=186817 RepID=A0ABR6CUH0_9BACI|nr:hypothetical protein [Peribacillus huizhouensis]MBA9028645.1 hypothetical protein [Peribacillus huizhouensis]